MSSSMEDDSLTDDVLVGATETVGSMQDITESALAVLSVGGFTYAGPVVLPVIESGVACPAILREEEARCWSAGGESRLADGCTAVCNLPIAPAGRVAGFTFRGFVRREALAEGTACPAILTAEAWACDNLGGTSSKDALCRDVCSKPIARRGRVAGFTFEGLVVRRAAAEGTACPAIYTQADAACDASGGTTVRDADCNVLCSTPMGR
jgi:hypothetical protein